MAPTNYFYEQNKRAIKARNLAAKLVAILDDLGKLDEERQNGLFDTSAVQYGTHPELGFDSAQNGLDTVLDFVRNVKQSNYVNYATLLDVAE